MDKKFLRIFFASVFFFSVAGFAGAMTPTLSISSTGNGDSVQINVYGDPNSSVLLFSGNTMPVLGTTNSSGNFSTTISSATYNILPNAAAYVKTGGINGAMSNQVVWPYFSNTTTNNNLTLSQSALLLNAGQTSTITAGASYLYLKSNSNPSIANINFNANQITVQALTFGSTVASICVVGSTSNCASITVTVQNSSAQQLNFSQNNFSVVSGQSIPVTVSGGSGVYTISNNSNSSVIQASLSGSVVTITSNNSTGASAITVCTTDMANCGILNVNATTVNSTAVTLSQTNPVVPLGQSTTVTIYGGTGSNFYVASNSNPSIVQANINGNILTLVGNASSGTSTISICAYAGSCASLTANVSNVSNGGAIVLSQNSISILAGQSTTVTISGGSTPYNFSSQNSTNIFNGTVSGNILTVYGVNAGSGTASVCSSVGCTNLSVTVNAINSSGNPPAFSQNNILINAGTSTTIYVSGMGSYYISNNSNPSSASVLINGNSAVVSGNNAGNSNISICQSNGQCAVLYVTVSAVTSQVITNVQPAAVVTPVIIFNRYLGYGDKGDDVLKLQQILVKLGFLSATPNGRYGPATKSAVKNFQRVHSIRQTGNMGPSTKDLLNQLEGGSQVSVSGQQTADQIQQSLVQLQAQLAAMLASGQH